MSHSSSKTIHSRDLPQNNSNPYVSMLKSKLFVSFPHPPPSTDLSQQTAIVTGASGGLGRESARHLLAIGLSHLVIAVRSVERGQSTATELQNAYPKAKIEVWHLEMESYESVQAFAKRCGEELDRVDIAILNAGMGDYNLNFSSTGHERTMQINFYSTVLLAILLLHTMKAKKTNQPLRLTIVNSDMSRMCKIPNLQEVPLLPTFDDEKWWSPQDRYGQSKLLGQLFLVRLAEHVSSNDVIINMVEPGFTKGTDLLRHASGISGAIFRTLNATMAHPAEAAALTYIDAVVVKGKESHGCVIDKCQVGP